MQIRFGGILSVGEQRLFASRDTAVDRCSAKHEGVRAMSKFQNGRSPLLGVQRAVHSWSYRCWSGYEAVRLEVSAHVKPVGSR